MNSKFICVWFVTRWLSALLKGLNSNVSMEDPGAAARLLKDFAKEKEAFEIKALAVGGELMGAEQIDRLATLPTRDQALAMLAGVIQAPITKLARTFNEFPSKITRAVAAVRDQKQDAA